MPPILVFRKAWRILNAFDPQHPELEFQEIRAATGLPATTCMRLVRNLVNGGVLAQTGDRYRIGLAPVRWALAARSGLQMVQLIDPLLEQLRDETGETAGLFVRQDSSRICISVAETTHSVVRKLSVGHASPVNAGAPGKVLLAFGVEGIPSGKLERTSPVSITDPRILATELQSIRARGYATSFGEWDIDLAGVAAPVFAADGTLAAAIGISAPAQRLTPERAQQVIPLVADIAREASDQLRLLSA